MSTRNIGDPGSAKRMDWWNRVVSGAYEITLIDQIRYASWRSILPGGTSVERRSDFWDGSRSQANHVLNELKGAFINAIEAYDREADAVNYPIGPFDSLAHAEDNIDLLMSISYDICWAPGGPCHDDDDASGDADESTDVGRLKDEGPLSEDGFDPAAPDPGSSTPATGGGTGSTPLTAIDPIYLDAPSDMAPGHAVEETAPPCSEEDEIPQTLPTCIKDPSAFVRDWSISDEPFLNSKYCQYYVPVTTDYDCPGADELEERVFSAIGDGVSSLLDLLNIGSGPSALIDNPDGPLKIAVLGAYIRERGSVAYEYEKAPRDKLRVLFKWPYGLISALGLVESTDPEISTPEGASSAALSAHGLRKDLSHLRKALKRLAYQQIFAAEDEEYTLFVDGTSREISLAQEVKLVQTLKASLGELLRKNNFVFPTNANRIISSRSQIGFPHEKARAEELLIMYNDEYQITAFFAKSVESGFKRLNMKIISEDSALYNPTMVSYLVNLGPLKGEMNTAEGLTIDSLATNYHYPKLAKTASNGVSGVPEGCNPGEVFASRLGEGAKNVVLEEAAKLRGNLASILKKYPSMNQQGVVDQKEKMRQSWDKFRDILKQQNSVQIPSGDSTITDIVSIIKQIENAEGDAIPAAWEALFNKLTATGLTDLVSKATKQIIKSDACGISPEAALKSLAKKILMSRPSTLEDLWNLASGDVQSAIRGPYGERVRDALADAGYGGGEPFPWQFNESLEADSARNLRGINFYNSDAFAVGRNRAESDEDPELAAFLEGYDYNFGRYDLGNMPQLEEYAFWLGFILAATEIYLYGARSGNPAFERPPLLPEPNPRSVVRTVTADFLNEQFVDLLILNTDIRELLANIKQIPIIGQSLNAVLQSSSDVAKSMVNMNVNNIFGDNVDVSQNNLPNLSDSQSPNPNPNTGFQNPIAQPNISAMMQQNVNTLWSAIQDAIIDALTTFLQNLILRLTLQLLKLAVSIPKGGLCERPGIFGHLMEGQLPEAVRETFDLKTAFEEAMCGEQQPGSDSSSPPRDDRSPTTAETTASVVDSRLAEVIASLSGLSTEEAAEILNGESNIIDLLAARLRADQFLDLLQGAASARLLLMVQALIEAANPALARALPDTTALRNFFLQLGAIFPPGYLDGLRNSLNIGGTEDVVQSICDEGGEAARERLAEKLREECGDQITEEQIQDQLDRFESRAADIVENLGSALAAGIPGATESAFGTVIEENLPKDDPANLIIAEEIVSIMFDPLYAVYARDLMRPMDPTFNGGFVNLVLSNANAIPQRGQIANHRAAFGFLSALSAGVFPFPSEDLSEDLLSSLDDKFFGVGDVASPNPRRRHPTTFLQARLKPANVGHYLKQIFRNFTGEIGTFTDVGTSDIVVYEENASETGFNLGFTIPGEDSIFTIEYEAGAGTIVMQPYRAYADNHRIVVVSSIDYRDVLADVPTLARNIYLATLQYFMDQAGEPERTPETMGTAILVFGGYGTGLAASGVTIPTLFEDYNILRRRMRENVLYTFARQLYKNHLSFDYGNYNLAELTNGQLLGHAPAPPGYEILGLPDGRISLVPPDKGGWLQIKDILLETPDEEFCCDEGLGGNLFDMELTRQEVLEGYKNAEDDPRLNCNPRTVSEPPYGRILARMNLAVMEGVVTSTIKTYIIEYFLKGMATFTTFQTSEEVFGPALAGYIAEKMKFGLLNQKVRPAAPAYPRGAIGEDHKLYAYWYEFLEQACQIMSRRVKDGRLYVTSPELDSAMATLQTAIEGYEYPQTWELLGERSALGNPFITLKNYRRKRKIDFIKATEPSAMIIFKHLIIDEMNRLASRVSEIFPGPPADDARAPHGPGWITSYSNLMELLFFSASTGNIFDVPGVLYDESPTALGRTLPSVGLGALDTSQFERGQYVLECYARPTINEDTDLSAALPSEIISGNIYGLGEFVDLLDGGVLDPSLPLSAYFAQVKYGLRVVYVLSPDDLDSAPRLKDILLGSLMTADIQNRLFRHAPWDDGNPNLGSYTTPVVYNPFSEEVYPPSATLSQFFDVVREGVRETGAYTASTTTAGAFNWAQVWQKMLASGGFKLFFDYSLQVQHVLSTLAIYNIEAFLDSIGVDDQWFVGPKPIHNYRTWNRRSFVTLRKTLKKMFKEIYNSQDFSYRSDPLGEQQARDVESTRRETDIDRSVSNPDLPPGTPDRIVFGSVVCPPEGEEPEVGTGSGPGVDPPAEEAEEPEGVSGGEATGLGAELSDSSWTGWSADNEAESAALIAWVDEISLVVIDADHQDFLADLADGFTADTFNLPSGFDLIAGAGGAWDVNSFGDFLLEMGSELGDVATEGLLMDLAVVAPIVTAMTADQQFEFVNNNYHNILSQQAAFGVIETMTDAATPLGSAVESTLSMVTTSAAASSAATTPATLMMQLFGLDLPEIGGY